MNSCDELFVKKIFLVSSKLLPIYNENYIHASMEETLKSTLETSDDIQYELYIKGLSEDNVRAISADLQEPERMLQLRLESLQKRYDMPYPSR
ncbi:hypothetical protein KA478_03955 [Patescibacteria group bacterium]|nr:hypothetical protein [Patescibacteria group bacterium]